MSQKFLVPLVLPADPTAALEAATKQYVDTKTAAPSAWTTVPYTNGASAYGGGFTVPSYRKAGDIVYLQGLVKLTVGTWATGLGMFTLPVGFRPLLMVRFIQTAYNGTADAPTPITIVNTGVVQPVAAQPANGYVFLDGMFFSTI